jgi:hypothetical protein
MDAFFPGWLSSPITFMAGMDAFFSSRYAG